LDGIGKVAAIQRYTNWPLRGHCGVAEVLGASRPRFESRMAKLVPAIRSAGRTRGDQVSEHVWLVTFLEDDLGYFDDETYRLEPIANPFGPKVLLMCSE